MTIGPTIVYDKSLMQRLSRREAEWLNHHFRGVLTPVFLAEVLGNLAKDFRGRSVPADVVSAFADKTMGLGTMPNIDHAQLILANLFGHPVEMSHRPIVGGGRRVTASNGETGIFIDEAPEAKICRRWSQREFTDEDRDWATQWRSGLKSIDLTVLPLALKRRGATHLPVSSLADAFLIVDRYLSDPEARYRSLQLAMEMFGLPSQAVRTVYQRWVDSGRPSLRSYAPYAYFCLRLTYTFLLGVSTRLISERPTNIVDLQYLYYLPFCSVFASGDKLHRELAPIFLTNKQMFIWADDLQEGLSALADYYEGLPESERARGSMTYARYPPQHVESVIHQAFDLAMPNWRNAARTPPVELTPERNAQIMAKLKPMMDAIAKSR